ncbi:hypothetical protein [Corynebacterium otitidis]|uniref:hypothetical protein n=1 Tax=Corynebacterium otitidis TaxID=29321 RepID=UPI000627E041|nr:hypothetical protein [Corynebacterium otitidis]KKO84067.1 hypothetical protein AAV33_03175 [Corynebacterium otitidis]
MSFFEDIASRLDREGIESRVGGDTLFVPITPEVELQFVEIDSELPAANVYVAAADVAEEDESFSAVLVQVAFSAEDALAAVSRHIAIDQVVGLLRDLVVGGDVRLAEVEFVQDEDDPHRLLAELTAASDLEVVVELDGDTPVATVAMLTDGEEGEERLELGEHADPERLFDVVALAARQAPLWEDELGPVEDDDYYHLEDLAGEDPAED